jgi:uncharacterized protein YqgC (DUF456 family)
MDTLLAIFAVLCGFVGLLGAIVPVLPGTIVSFIGLVLVNLASWSEITNTQLIVWGVVSLVVIILDYILPGYFSKLFGGSKRGIMGANIGVFAGIFFGPWGIILGPFVGAFVGELLNDSTAKDRAFNVACGSLLSFFTGTGLKLVTGGMMFYYIVKDIVIAVSDKM